MSIAFAVTNNLDWTVSKRPLFFNDESGNPVQWESKVAVVRDDTGAPLGAVSSDYEIVQNSDLLSLINPMVDEGILEIKKMGYLNNGARVFAQAKINHDFQVVGEDYQAYITLLNGHVGNHSVAIGPSAVRVVCGNTFTMAMADIKDRYRHFKGVNQVVLESKAVINYVESCMKKYSEKAEALKLNVCSIGNFHKGLEKIFKRDVNSIRQVEQLNKLFYNGAGNDGRTYYDAFNAITDFSSNSSRRTAEGRFNYSNFGSGTILNSRAMNVFSEMATV